MKRNTFIILCTGLLLFFGQIQVTYATDQTGAIALREQTQSLLEQIKDLKSLIARLILQKEILAESYLVIDMSNGSVILEKNANQEYSIASITKLMNAVVVRENLDNAKSITLTREMLKPEGQSPSLFLNSNVTVKNLLKASLIQSVNDAAQSLSYVIGNEKFLGLMNQKANELGMVNTRFFDVHGLDPKNHSTAKDLAKLLEYVDKNHPELWEITKNDDFWLPDVTGKLLKFKNMNNFYALPEFIGGKTGYLPQAKQTLASMFNLEEKPVAIVLLRSKNRQTDTVKIIDWIKNGNVLNSQKLLSTALLTR